MKAEGRFSVVVGGLDTEAGRAAIQAAAEQAQRNGGALHVAGYVEPALEEDEQRPYAQSVEAKRAEVQALVEGVIGGPSSVTVHVPLGATRPSQAILRVAREVDADLIVIGLRQRSAVSKLVLGSAAQEILLGAECPVLSIPAP